MNLTIQPVTARARARPAPGRLAGYAQRYADDTVMKHRPIARHCMILAVGVPAVLMVAAVPGYLGTLTRDVLFGPGWVVVVDALFGNHSAGLRTIGILGVAIVSWLFWIALCVAIVVGASGRLAVAILIAMATLAPVLYLSFRTTKYDVAGGFLEVHRSWGRITHFEQDQNGDGRIDHEAWYSWHQPLVDMHSPPQRTRADQNGDGRWDTWVDYATDELRIDVDGDEMADKTLMADREGYAEARRLRGY